MKLLYILSAMVIIGILLISISSFKVFSVVQQKNSAFSKRYPGVHRKAQPVPVDPETRMYVGLSYIGITLFVVGSLGAIIVLFQNINRRF